MSLKLIKSQEDCLRNSEEPSLVNSQITHQKKWVNSWSFKLHEKILLRNRGDDLTHCIETKRMIKKYFGKKILYVVWSEDLSALVSRSKLLKYADIESNYINNCLKYKGNLAILSPFVHQLHGNYFQYPRSLHLKKIIKYCQRVCFRSEKNLGSLKYMSALRNLSLHLRTVLKTDLLGKAFCNLLKLETIKIDYLAKEVPILHQKYRFLSRLHQLPHLENLKFITDYETVQYMEQDLDEFSRKPHSFSFHFKISLADRFIETKENSGLWKILNLAEEIRIEDWRHYLHNYRDSLQILKELKEVDKKNTVEISMKCFEERIGSYWSFQNNRDSSNSYAIPLKPFLCQIKEKCHFLRSLDLDLSTMHWKGRDPFDIDFVKDLLENFQEISTFDKLKRLGLLTTLEDLKIFPLGQILSNKNLETFQLRLRAREESMTSLEWDNCLMMTTTSASQMKKLKISIAKSAKTPLFGMNLLNYIRKLENLEVVQLIDGNLELITFDFLYGFVTSLLEKKNMKRILICTKVENNVYSENFGELFSKSVGIQLKNLLKEISQDLEKKVKVLKDLQLEEIIVGKLNGYGFDYLFYKKEMQVVDKLFWKEKEIEELLSRNSQLASLYKEVFSLFRIQEPSIWGD